MKSALLMLLAAPLFAATAHAAPPDVAGAMPASATLASTKQTWNRTAAAKYLDHRQAWWQSWAVARRDHKTVCVSCHTVLPYALSRSSLRESLGEQAPSPAEHVMLTNVLRRVTLWNQVGPFYFTGADGPNKTPESRGTEAVLNALVLTTYDAPRHHLTDITRTAFDEAWALQIKTGPQSGAWDWLNFHLAPWESNESQYYGAALAAIAVGRAPDNYRSTPAIQPSLKLLRSYLRHGYEQQPLINKIYLLWASAKLDGLLSSSERSKLLTAILSMQQPDGGWSLTDLGSWKREDNTPLETKSDGYATGLTLVALENSGLAHHSSQAAHGLAWLEHNQIAAEGKWPAWSVNKRRDPASDIGRFMSDAATGFAVLALESSH